MTYIPREKWNALSPHAKRCMLASGIVAEPYQRPRSKPEQALRGFVGVAMAAMCFATLVIAWLVVAAVCFGGGQ